MIKRMGQDTHGGAGTLLKIHSREYDNISRRKILYNMRGSRQSLCQVHWVWPEKSALEGSRDHHSMNFV